MAPPPGSPPVHYILIPRAFQSQSREPFQTTDADLAGFWDMVLLQVADVDGMFTELDELRRHNWITNNAHLVTVSTSVIIQTTSFIIISIIIIISAK